MFEDSIAVAVSLVLAVLDASLCRAPGEGVAEEEPVARRLGRCARRRARRRSHCSGRRRLYQLYCPQHRARHRRNSGALHHHRTRQSSADRFRRPVTGSSRTSTLGSSATRMLMPISHDPQPGDGRPRRACAPLGRRCLPVMDFAASDEAIDRDRKKCPRVMRSVMKRLSKRWAGKVNYAVLDARFCERLRVGDEGQGEPGGGDQGTGDVAAAPRPMPPPMDGKSRKPQI